MDLTRFSPLVRLGVGDFPIGHATLNAASNKGTKHEKMCSDNQHVFIPFAFDIFCFLASKVVDLLRKVQRVMQNNVLSPRSINIVFTKFDFVIQKNITTQLVGFPSIHV